MKFRRYLVSGVTALALSLCMSGAAFADGVIYAPGVNISGQTGQAGPGGGNADNQNITNAPTATEQGSGTAQSADTPSDAAAGSSSAAQSGDTASGSDINVIGPYTQAGSNVNVIGPGAQTGTDTQQGPGTEQDSGTGTEAGSGENGTQSGTAASTDIETLKARSLADPYTIFPTSDPNIVVSRGRTIDKTKPMLALTYDDGPRTDVGERLMNVFEQYGQRTTFFMVGSRVASRASELQRMVTSGHEVANHTYDHVYLNKAGAETIQNQVAACNNIIEQTCGVRPRVMRLPGGNKNATVLANVAMPIILWNVDTRDWSHRDTQKTIDAVLGKVKDGDIVLMHELYESTAAASEYLVPKLVEQGFELVTVSELAALKGRTLNAGEVYYSIK